MFSGNHYIANSSVTNNLSGGLIQNLADKLWLDHNATIGVANDLVLNVMQSPVQKTNDPDDNSFDIQGISTRLSGGSTSGLNVQDLLNEFNGVGLDQDGDGDT